MTRFAVSHYAALGALVLVAYHLGRRLTRRLTYASNAEAFACATGLGLAAFAYAMFAAGLADLLTRSVAVGVLVAAVVLSAREWRDSIRTVSTALSRLPSAGMHQWLAIVAAAAVVPVLVPVLSLPLYPPSEFDATAYHLAIARQHVEAQTLVVSPYLRFAVLPQTANLLFSMALLLYDDILAQLLQFVSLILVLVALVAFGRRHFTARAGYWAAALAAGSPLVLWLAATAYVDMMAVYYAALCALAWWNWQTTRERSWAVVAGVLAGIAISVKYSSVFLLLPLGAAAIVGRPNRKRIADMLVVAVVALAIMTPWMVRAAYYSHNPIYPFFFRTFGQLFGYGTLGAEHYVGFFGDMNQYGVGKQLGDLLRLPWNLAVNPAAFDAPAPFAPAIFVTLPLLIVGLTRHAGVVRLMAVVLAATVVWFFSKQVVRFWLPVLPLLCLAIGVSLDALIGAFSRARDATASHRTPRSGVRRFAAASFSVIVAALLASAGWLHAAAAVRERGPLPVTAEERDQYLAHRLTPYPLLALLRREGNTHYRMYAIYGENLAYFADGTLLGHYGGPARYELIFDKLHDAGALHRVLTQLGADYLLVDEARTPVPILRDAAFRRRFTFVASRRTATLFDLTDRPLLRLPQPERLTNPGFEATADGLTAGWSAAGAPVIDGTGQNSHGGSVAVQCSGPENVLFQSVPVDPGMRFALSLAVREASPRAPVRLQVNWSDTADRYLGTDFEVVESTPRWKRHEMIGTVPSAAARATVYAACHQGGRAWLDDVSFTDLAFVRGDRSEPDRR